MNVIQETEVVPTYPEKPGGLSADADALDSDALWARIEAYTSWRFTVREVTWIVEGPGWFVPRLKPATVTTSKVWADGGYQDVTLDAAPIGYALDCETYLIKADVGQTTVPAEINEAYRRFAEYLADDSYIGLAASSGTRNVGESLGVTSERPATWQAKALQYSGAADLLRRWRR